MKQTIDSKIIKSNEIIIVNSTIKLKWKEASVSKTCDKKNLVQGNQNRNLSSNIVNSILDKEYPIAKQRVT